MSSTSAERLAQAAAATEDADALPRDLDGDRHEHPAEVATSSVAELQLRPAFRTASDEILTDHAELLESLAR